MEKKQRTEEESDPLDQVSAGEESGPHLMEPGKMLTLVRQKTFDMGDVEESADELRKARGFKADEKELREIKKELKALHGEIRAGEPSLQDRKRLEWINLAEKGVNSSLEDMKKTGRTMKWEKLTAGLDTPPSPVYEAYFKETDVPLSEMKEILALTDDLHRDDSTQKIGGNRVTPLMKGEIWATKMQLLDEAIKNPQQEGKPVEIDVEYYELSSPEMMQRLRSAAESGAKVRVLTDPGRLEGSGTVDATSIAVRADMVHTLLEGMEDKDMAVTMYPNSALLGGRDKLMHRKMFRVGETVVFGGMNANSGSGENVDFAMKIEGPATKRMGEVYKEDVEQSAGRSLDEIYGTQMDLIEHGDSPVTLSPWGFKSLVRTVCSPGSVTGAGNTEEVDGLIEAAGNKGIKLAELADFPDRDGDGRVSTADVRASLLSGGTGALTLTDQGRGLLAEAVELSVGKTADRKNVARLNDTVPPDGKLPEGATGKDILAVGSSSVERQALVLEAISSADKFIKVSAFVLNDDLAKLLIEKKREKEGQGEEFQVQVVMDPGMYGYGGTPNEPAYKRLEDAGIPVRWSLLDRTDPHHDRKNHSKLMITDRMILTGSTNFSTKGLRSNWEVNDVAYFNEDDPESMKKQAEVVKNYDRMWNREAIGVDTAALARDRYAGYKGDDREVRTEKHRGMVIKDFIRNIETFEVQMGTRLSKEAQRPDVQEALTRRTARGENRGYALLSCFSDDQVDTMRKSLPAWKALQDMRSP
jgi:phosphatidylserine/phosphatidylglycerophosphate/cardiolipin synthase-like enzyme